MPELPEVECVRRSLEPLLVGAEVRRVEIARPDVCECHSFTITNSKTIQPTPARLLEGCHISTLIRHGKQIGVLTNQGPALCVHLGMSGQFADLAVIRLQAQSSPAHKKHIHIIWHLSTGAAVCFRDPRRFGGVWAYESESDLRNHRFAPLGPDALEITGDDLHARAGTSRRAVKAALLDQGIIAGVGNIYADEALFAAKVSPTRPCTDITTRAWNTIAQAIQNVLRKSIVAGGSTLRDYVDASGNPGTNQKSHAVYARAAKPCLRCRTPLTSDTIAQRTTVWCARCQS